MALKSLQITYHKCIKWLLGYPPWYGNHDACDKIKELTLLHRINYEVFKFMFRVIGTDSPCIKPFKYHLKSYGILKNNATNIAKNCYGIDDILKNDLDAVYSRIKLVYDSEQRSDYYLSTLS